MERREIKIILNNYLLAIVLKVTFINKYIYIHFLTVHLIILFNKDIDYKLKRVNESILVLYILNFCFNVSEGLPHRFILIILIPVYI